MNLGFKKKRLQSDRVADDAATTHEYNDGPSGALYGPIGYHMLADGL